MLLKYITFSTVYKRKGILNLVTDFLNYLSIYFISNSEPHIFFSEENKKIMDCRLCKAFSQLCYYFHNFNISFTRYLIRTLNT